MTSSLADCDDIRTLGYGTNGTYVIKPEAAPRSVSVVCEFHPHEVWTLIQRRQDGSQVLVFVVVFTVIIIFMMRTMIIMMMIMTVAVASIAIVVVVIVVVCVVGFCKCYEIAFRYTHTYL